jgi:hypothetical protein
MKSKKQKNIETQKMLNEAWERRDKNNIAYQKSEVYSCSEKLFDEAMGLNEILNQKKIDKT